MRTRHVGLALAAFAFAATRASAFEFHGYFRDGVGFNSKGGGQVCFQLPGSEFKSRLGNECEHYWELSLSDTIYKDADSGIEAKVEFMPAYGLSTTVPGGNGNNFGFGTGNVYTQQAWGGIKLPALAGATVWAGQRYYRRHNVESDDWFYWNPYQGLGAGGIEDIDVGFGKLAFTLGRMDGSLTVPATAATAAYMLPEARIYGIPVNPNGALEIGIDLAIASDQGSGLGAGRRGVSPWFTVEHFQDKFLGGFNKLTFQYASGAVSTMTSGALTGATSDPKQWRIIEQVAFFPIPEVSGQFILIYQDQDNLLNGGVAQGSGAKIFTGEIRPSFHFSDSFKLQGDVFYQTLSVKNSSAVAGAPSSAATLLKVTVAPTIVTGRGFFARPEFRVFATYGVWNDSAVALASTLNPPATTPTIASGAFGSDKNGLSFGVQMEAWW
jgi:maltoporin